MSQVRDAVVQRGSFRAVARRAAISIDASTNVPRSSTAAVKGGPGVRRIESLVRTEDGGDDDT